jgi:hypothetical protein
VVAAAGLAAGCATYSDRVLRANRAASAGGYATAVTEMNGVLGVESAAELPDDWGADRALATLERGTLQQSLDHWRESARDLSAAEQELELLDLSRDPVGEIGRYLYSDSARPYRTPPTERLALNPVNMLNYLAVGDLDGAAVEARRFQVMREYLASREIAAHVPARLGAYLAGFVFERRGEGDRALRYYEEALAEGHLASLDAPVRRLARVYPYRGPHLDALLASAGDGAPSSRPEGELLVVLSVGRVPHKVPARIPAGVAVGLAGTAVSGNVDWLKYGAGKVIVYPELVPTPSVLGSPTVRVDGRDVAVEELVDLGSAIREEYEAMKPQILAAALSRLAARAAVAEGVRAAGSQETQLLGDLLSIFTEFLLVALDRPDTRSWTMLPATVLVARVPLAPGAHDVEVSFGGGLGARRVPVDVAPGGQATVVVVTEPR